MQFISDPPTDQEALDAYSHAVTSVAERLAPSVASLRVSKNVSEAAEGLTEEEARS